MKRLPAMKLFAATAASVFATACWAVWWLGQQFTPRFEIVVETGLWAFLGVFALMLLWQHVHVSGFGLVAIAVVVVWALALPFGRIAFDQLAQSVSVAPLIWGIASVGVGFFVTVMVDPREAA